MRYPVNDWSKWYSAQGFGNKTSYGFHDGEDINLLSGGNSDLGQPLLAIADGEVTSVHEHSTGFGKHIHIKHTGEWGEVFCHYAHCDSIMVKLGDKVTEGQQVATLGSTGNSQYAHLHWAIKLAPTGIDGIADTLERLKLWTAPIEFVEKWSKVITQKSEEVIGLEADLAEQRKQVTNLQTQVNGLLLDIGGWEAKYNETVTQLNEAKSNSDGFRKQYNDLIAKLAQKLDTRQEEVEILGTVDTLLTYEDKAIELDRTIALERRNHAEAIDVLEKKIASLESDLLTVKKELQSVKDTQPKPIVITPPKSVIIDIIRKLLGR